MDNSMCEAKCLECGFKEQCKGCRQTDGNPFGKGCVAYDYIKAGGKENFAAFKKKLTDEINALNIEGMPKINELFSLAGFYVNLAYPMPNGEKVKFMDDGKVYLGNQVECMFDDGRGERCFGIVADSSFILVATYGENGTNPELVMYKHR